MLQEQETRALETMENVVAFLRALPDRDHPLNCLIDAIEDDRARLLALALGSQLTGRTPPRMSTIVQPGQGAGVSI
jgi:hypothetical protein